MQWGQLTSAPHAIVRIGVTCLSFAAAIAACGASSSDGEADASDDLPPDASLLADNFFAADGVHYDLVWAEAYMQADPPALVIRSGGDPDGSCSPAEQVGCYELVARLPTDALGEVTCGADATLTLIIDGGAGPTFIAGAPFDGPCSIDVERVDPVGGAVVLRSMTGTLRQVGEVELGTTITNALVIAPRGDDR